MVSLERERNVVLEPLTFLDGTFILNRTWYRGRNAMMRLINVRHLWKIFTWLFVSLTVVFMLTIGSVASVHANEARAVDWNEVARLQDELISRGYEGDISEDALRRIYENSFEKNMRFASANGCSTPQLTKVLTKKYDRLFKHVCDAHDRCYSPSSSVSRKSCDERFRKGMTSVCRKEYGNTTNPRSKTGDCIGTASIYYHFVRAFGKSHYKGKGNRAWQ